MQAMRAPMERMSKSISKFIDVSGLRRVGEAFGSIARAAGAAFRSVAALVPAMGALTGAATLAGMAKLVSSFTDYERELRIVADRTGQTVQQTQQLRDAYVLAGGSASDMDSVLEGLTDSTKDASIHAGEALATFNQLGIKIKDANGNIRPMSQLLPEVIAALNKIPNPAQRAQMAMTLLGGSGEKFLETLRTANKTWGEYLDIASRMPTATQEQRDALIRLQEAQSHLQVSFTHLGETVSGVLAQHFTPLLEKLGDFVDKNTPAITAAIDKIAGQFADWLGNISWDDVQSGMQSLTTALVEVGKLLGFVIEHANEIVKIFEIYWGVKIVAAIGKVSMALGTLGGASGGGVGLLGALGQFNLVLGTILASWLALKGLEAGSDWLERKSFGDKRVDDKDKMMDEGSRQFWRFFGNPFGWGNEPGEAPANQAPGNAPQGGWRSRGWAGGAPGTTPGGTAGGPATPPPANLSTNTLERGAQIRDSLATDLAIPAHSAAGMVGNLWHESKLGAEMQEKNPLVPGSRGGWGWAMWTGPRRVEMENWAKAHNLDPKSDAANYGFLVEEVRKDPKLLEMLRNAKTASEAADIVQRYYERPAVLQNRGPASERFAAASAPKIAQGPPAQGPGAPPNGKVDVAITGTNLPAGTKVTATGSGAGVNVPPPRVEQAQLASI